MKAYSKDLRLKVLAAVDRGMPRKEVARTFGTSLPSIKRWLERRRESGDVEPSPIPGPPARKGAVLEGLGAHKTGRVRELIEQRGADLLFLPSYSPDLNPIEEAFSKIKTVVRKAGARTRETLDEAISEAFWAVTLEDVAGWFSHCGYEPRDQYS